MQYNPNFFNIKEMMNPSVQESPKRLAEAVKKEGSKIKGPSGTLDQGYSSRNDEGPHIFFSVTQGAGRYTCD